MIMNRYAVLVLLACLFSPITYSTQATPSREQFGGYEHEQPLFPNGSSESGEAEPLYDVCPITTDESFGNTPDQITATYANLTRSRNYYNCPGGRYPRGYIYCCDNNRCCIVPPKPQNTVSRFLENYVLGNTVGLIVALTVCLVILLALIGCRCPLFTKKTSTLLRNTPPHATLFEQETRLFDVAASPSTDSSLSDPPGGFASSRCMHYDSRADLMNGSPMGTFNTVPRCHHHHNHYHHLNHLQQQQQSPNQAQTQLVALPRVLANPMALEDYEIRQFTETEISESELAIPIGMGQLKRCNARRYKGNRRPTVQLV